MAPPMSTAAAIDLTVTRSANVLSLAHGTFNPAVDASNPAAAARFRLLNTLQSSLNLDEILIMFQSEVDALLKITGIRYNNEPMDIEIVNGVQSTRQCAYRLITQSDHLGEIILYRDTRFNDNELESVESLLSLLLSPVRNALLYRIALAASLTDPLTGAGNRTAMVSNLQRETSLARRTGQQLSVLVIDIDRFKYINDTHGHSVGDLVLRELVNIINRVNRSTDLCFRMGGEEFVILLSNTNKSGAEVIANRLCKAISECHICTEDGLIQISVSIGASTQCETDTDDSLLSRADRAMYDVKRRGGNNIIWF